MARARPWLALASSALIAACFLQRPGELTFDTKLDMVVAPARFLARSLHLWDPSASFGQIQNQAVGYLFPMGPWFVAADVLGVPMWMAQRAWIALLLVVGLAGIVRLAARLGLGSPGTRVVGGLAYVLAPSVTGQIGAISGAVIATMLVPWVVLPLVTAARGESVRRGAALSGLAILAMGGINAACTLAVLPLPLLYVLTRPRSPRRRALVLWWSACVALACAWWLFALVLQGRWGFDFVAFTETAAVTESTTSATETLRGAGAWLYYLNLGAPWLPAGWLVATSATAIIASSLVAAAGLAGLAGARLAERRFLLWSLALGVILVSAGYGGRAGGVADDAIRSLLGGSLAPFRNVHKFEPLLRVPLALGVVVTLNHLAARTPLLQARRTAAHGLASAAILVAVVACALPFLQGEATLDRSFRTIPPHWEMTAAWLDRHASDTTALVVPAAPFADYAWGRATDEPLQPLARTPWAVRSLIPLGGLGSTRLLDAVEERLASGRASRGLIPILARSGVGHVVVRNDLDWRRAGAPQPTVVHAAVEAAGMRRVMSFGPMVRAGADPATEEPGDAGTAAELPSIEIFAVPDPVRRATTYAQDGMTVIDGGADSLMQLADRGGLGRGAAVLAGDLSGDDLAVRARRTVTDSVPRRGSDFGLIRDNESYVLSRGERAAGQSGTRQLLESELARHQPVAVNRGGARITASSYGSWLVQLPELAPAKAFDGDAATAWVPGRAEGSDGEWLQATFAAPRRVASLGVSLLRDGPWRPGVARVRVTTTRGSVSTSLQPTGRMQQLAVPAGPTTFVRVLFEEVVGEDPSGSGPGLAEVRIPGVRVRRARRVSSDLGAGPAAADPAFSLRRSIANPFSSLRSDEELALDRVIVLPRPAPMRLTGTVVPLPGRALDRLLSFPRGLSVTGTSSWNGLPRWRVGNAVDSSRNTAWIAATPVMLRSEFAATPGLGPLTSGDVSEQSGSPVPIASDASPRIRLRWSGRKTLGRLRIVPATEFAAAPTRVRITSSAGRREFDVAPARMMRFPVLRGVESVTVSFPGPSVRRGINADGSRSRLPVGLADLDFPALRKIRLVAPPPATKVERRCGDGPDIEVDQRRIRTRVRSTVAALTALKAVRFETCGAAPVTLTAGEHAIRSRPLGAFAVTDLELRPRRAAASTRAPRAVRVTRWATTRRTTRVAAGPASFLALPQNFNAGWRARIADRTLEPVRLDGWMQGFVVPAGGAATVEIDFAPDRVFRWSLIVGAVLAAALLPLALVRRRRDGGAPVGTVVGEQDAAGTGASGLPIARIAAVTVAVLLVSWPVALILPLFAVAAAAGRRRLLAALAGGGMIAAGLVAALQVDANPIHQAGAFGLAAQLLAAGAFAAALATAWVRDSGSAPGAGAR